MRLFLNASNPTRVMSQQFLRTAPLLGAIFFLIIIHSIGNLVPAFQAPDEPIHFSRTIEVSKRLTVLQRHAKAKSIEGLLYTDIDSFYEYIQQTDPLYNRAAPPNRTETKSIMNSRIDELYSISYMPGFNLRHQMLGYTGINYFPQSLAVELGSLFNQTLSSTYLIGRFFQELIASLVFGLSLFAFSRHQSWAGGLGIIILTLPMTLHLISSFSGDALVIESSILLAIITDILITTSIAKSISSRDNGPQLSLTTIGLLLSYAVFISKASYIPIALALAVISYAFLRAKFFVSHKKTSPLLLSILGGIALITTVSVQWLRYTTPALRGLFESRLDASIQLQRKSELIQDPTQLISAIWATISSKWADLARETIGVLGSLNKPLPHIYWYQACSAALVLFALIPLVTKRRLTTQGTACNDLIIGSLIAVFTGLWMSCYLVFGAVWTTWSSASSLTIEGLQGRHFLPLLSSMVIFTRLLSLSPFWPASTNTSASRNLDFNIASYILGVGICINIAAYTATIRYWY